MIKKIIGTMYMHYGAPYKILGAAKILKNSGFIKALALTYLEIIILQLFVNLIETLKI